MTLKFRTIPVLVEERWDTKIVYSTIEYRTCRSRVIGVSNVATCFFLVVVGSRTRLLLRASRYDLRTTQRPQRKCNYSTVVHGYPET